MATRARGGGGGGERGWREECGWPGHRGGWGGGWGRRGRSGISAERAGGEGERGQLNWQDWRWKCPGWMRGNVWLWFGGGWRKEAREIWHADRWQANWGRGGARSLLNRRAHAVSTGPLVRVGARRECSARRAVSLPHLTRRTRHEMPVRHQPVHHRLR